MGTAVTPAQNAYGSWTALMTLTESAYLIEILATEGSTINEARAHLISIGVDTTGGDNYQELIPDLTTWNPTLSNIGPGVLWRFPMFIPGGASVAARASVNNVTVRTVNIWTRCFGRPTRPDLIRYGSVVTAYNVDYATSTGSAGFSLGTNGGFSAWTQIGVTTDQHWWMQAGYGLDQSGTNARGHVLQFSWGEVAGANMIGVMRGGTSTSEHFWTSWSPRTVRIPAGQRLWARGSQNSTSPPVARPMLYGLH